ncbi:roadblock/LC7 domain-containing protein [Actinophytocola sp.]|uniref:roadblock/LC7 domain-containing protein n=1 Tax=Actinophytocola sp. TaxID=1872138 RepID=UPI003D6C613C
MTYAPHGDLTWFLDDFVVRVPDVAHTIVVSADGILLARSSTLPPANADQLAAVSSGLASLSEAAARTFDAGNIVQTCVEMEQGYLFMMTMGPGASLAVLASPDCEMGLLAYEMTVLVEQVGERLTPELRAARGLASRAGGLA